MLHILYDTMFIDYVLQFSDVQPLMQVCSASKNNTSEAGKTLQNQNTYWRL